MFINQFPECNVACLSTLTATGRTENENRLSVAAASVHIISW